MVQVAISNLEYGFRSKFGCSLFPMGYRDQILPNDNAAARLALDAPNGAWAFDLLKLNLLRRVSRQGVKLNLDRFGSRVNAGGLIDLETIFSYVVGKANEAVQTARAESPEDDPFDRWQIEEAIRRSQGTRRRLRQVQQEEAPTP